MDLLEKSISNTTGCTRFSFQDKADLFLNF